jgi:hypothetical protein
MKLEENFVKYFFRFLGNGVSRKNAFEFYWHLMLFHFFSIIDRMFSPKKQQIFIELLVQEGFFFSADYILRNWIAPFFVAPHKYKDIKWERVS